MLYQVLILPISLTIKRISVLAGSQTVIRPEFRELSSFAFYDFDLGATVAGNPSLQRTKVTNADLRYEIYPRAGELFTVGVFYKYFQLPDQNYFSIVQGRAVQEPLTIFLPIKQTASEQNLNSVKN